MSSVAPNNTPHGLSDDPHHDTLAALDETMPSPSHLRCLANAVRGSFDPENLLTGKRGMLVSTAHK